MSPQDLEELQAIQDARRRRANVETFKAIFAETDKASTAAAGEVTDENIASLVHESR